MILVTGGAGFLGRRILHALAAISDQPIRCIVRPGTAGEIIDALVAANPEVQLEFVPVSFNDTEGLRQAVDGVDVVYHVAASMSGSYASMVANTVVGSENLYEACAAAGVGRFVLVSSFSVISSASVPRGNVIDETTPLEPHPEKRDPYAFAKHRQESLAWEYARDRGLPLVVVRPGVIFGPPNGVLGPRIGVDVFGLFLHLGGRNLIPLTQVENCAELIARSGLEPCVEGEIFCAVDDDLPTSAQLLRRHIREIHWVPRIWLPYWMLRLMARINVWMAERSKGHWPKLFTPYDVETLWKGHRYSNAKAKRLLNWVPRVPMKAALDETYAFLKTDAASND